jgi:hypothetical protein
MDIQSIIREIENLSLSQQVELNSILTERLKKRGKDSLNLSMKFGVLARGFGAWMFKNTLTK